MSRADFIGTLEQLPHASRIMLVGLGEPLLHPEAVEFVRIAVARGRRVGLVSNAMQLDERLAVALCSSGLAGITFSIDAVDPAAAARVRRGSDMQLISANIQRFMTENKQSGSSIGTSVFTALTGETLHEFASIVDFVADHGIDALMVTDLNFPSNQARSVHRALDAAGARFVRTALQRAVARRLPVLSVRGLEELGLHVHYRDYLLRRAAQLAHRSERHTHCLSPWQSVPVSVEGNLSICDCQPTAVLGNIHRTPVAEWWNGPAMRAQRSRMLGDDPPAACRVCPRF
jgi:MoaA/NifB/PqqE/SkfB family radical SAM enzyme